MVAKAIERSGASLEMLREMAANPQGFQVTTDGGWPRMGWKKVLLVCIYDGWPYWKPGPALLVSGALGGEWYWFDSLTGVERRLLPASAAE
jgi:hypothetical protein